jgi:hypothetical protein
VFDLAVSLNFCENQEPLRQQIKGDHVLNGRTLRDFDVASAARV